MNEELIDKMVEIRTIVAAWIDKMLAEKPKFFSSTIPQKEIILKIYTDRALEELKHRGLITCGSIYYDSFIHGAGDIDIAVVPKIDIQHIKLEFKTGIK